MLGNAATYTAIQQHVDHWVATMPDSDNVNARDWAGFFAGLAQLFVALLPLILPLFMQPKEEIK